MREGAATPSTARAATENETEAFARSAPVVEIAIGAAVIRVSAAIGEAELRRVIRAVRSA
ncbi:hypothetical protein [Rhodoblastus sp.]|uniref:hypothetical protein n=1 Tax=Rhodoblastus sp. TaxID=1962975 RepID=UPI003F94C9B6